MLAVAQVLLVKRMVILFGARMTSERRTINYSLSSFFLSYIMRVGVDIVLVFKDQWVQDLFYGRIATFIWTETSFWFIWDIVPICILFGIHYINLNSFSQDPEVLNCEYTVDDGISERSKYELQS